MCHTLLVSLLLVVLVGTPALADQTVTLPDGRSAVLKDIGTWEYLAETEPDTINLAMGEPFLRNLRWGMSREEVIAAEPSKILSQNFAVIFFQVNLLGEPWALLTVFEEEKLVSAAYAHSEDHSNSERGLSEYDELKTQLSQKYGPPTIDEEKWFDPALRNPSLRAYSFSTGKMKVRTVWYAGSADIVLQAGIDSLNLSFSLIYSPPGFYKASQEVDPTCPPVSSPAFVKRSLPFSA